ncbi:MAG: sporulation protein [Chloroflexota bacterium]|nr:sporulation protein [Chloroflexota bacterium]
MNPEELLGQVRDALTVKRAFGEAYERDGMTIIPVAEVAGGGGGGGGGDEQKRVSGTGGGFGLRVKPAGAYVIANGTVTWRPAVDVNRIVFMAQLVAIVFLLTVRSVAKHRRR